jgi:FkbM family methyltransferase
LVCSFNVLSKRVPFRVKYGIGTWLRRGKSPYDLVNGKTVIQIGSPYDTLAAGRSRAVYFSLMAGSNGRVVVIEPEPTSVECLRRTLQSQCIKNTTVCQSGAWSGSGSLVLRVDRAHPATNFIEGTVNYEKARLDEFERVEVPVNTVDEIVKSLAIDPQSVDLVSCTTNHSEEEILKGMANLIASGLKFISLAYGTSHTRHVDLLNRIGYDLHAFDDRGVTFKRKAA